MYVSSGTVVAAEVLPDSSFPFKLPRTMEVQAAVAKSRHPQPTSAQNK